jgi:Fur family iron response transcriptional regulator
MLNKIEVFDPLNDYNRAIHNLKKNNIRPTKQRMILAKILFEKGRRHVSAENLYDEVKKDDRKISLATIYNTLKQFTQIGLIREIVVDQNKSLYCTNKEPHYHLYIEDEGKIVDIPTKNIDLNIPSIPACLNLHNIDVIVRIRTLKDKDIY